MNFVFFLFDLKKLNGTTVFCTGSVSFFLMSSIS